MARNLAKAPYHCQEPCLGFQEICLSESPWPIGPIIRPIALPKNIDPGGIIPCGNHFQTIQVINPSHQNCSSHLDCSRPSNITLSKPSELFQPFGLFQAIKHHIIHHFPSHQSCIAALLASQLLILSMARRNNTASRPRPRLRSELEDINIYNTPK